MSDQAKTGYRPELYTEEAKRARFVRVVERRTTNILNTLRLLGNVANTNLYSDTDAEIDKIFHAIEKSIVEIRGKFHKSKKKDVFRL